MNKIGKLAYTVLGLCAAALLVFGISFIFPREQTKSQLGMSSGSTSKRIHTGSGAREYFSLQEMCEKAQYIIVGRVLSREEAVFPIQDSIPHTPVIFQVEQTIKGNPADSKVTFLELGGETQTDIYIVEGINHYQPGDRAFLFMRENGAPLGSYSDILLTEDPIQLPPDKFEGLSLPNGYTNKTVGWIQFSEDEFVDYVTGIVKSLE